MRQTLVGDYSVDKYGIGSWDQVGSGDELGSNGQALDNSLHGVSCSSSTRCYSVGYYFDDQIGSYQPVETQYSYTNGSWGSAGFAVFPDSPPGNGYLYGVSCTSTSFCPAVGNYIDSSGVAQSLAEVYNGSSWSVVSSPDSGSGNNYLYGVSCVSTSFCAAVGYYVDSSGVTQSLAGTYNGSSWSASAATNTASFQDNYLYGVSCTSSTFCASVGYGYAQPGFSPSWGTEEIYNGSSWSSPSILDPSTDSTQPGNDYRLYGVFCMSSSSCLTSGRYSSLFSLAESYAGSSWSLGSAVNPSTTQNDLYDISCPSSTFCVAVGYYYNSSDVQQMLVETYNGSSWSQVTGLTNPASSAGDMLDGVSCTSSTSCVAVGSYLYVNTTTSASGIQTLAEVYNGSSWTTETPGNQGSYSDSLVDVSCASSTSCVAVGYYGTSQTSPTESVLTEYYNGSSWSVNSPTSPSTTTSTLMGISCTSTSFCEAVGNYVDSSGITQTLAEVYNGSSWSEQSAADSGSGQNLLADVSCTSSSFCMATGEYSVNTTTGATATLAEAYNGSSWSVVSSPDVGSGNNVLYGASCTSSTSCAGVGYEANTSAFTTNFSAAAQITQTLGEQWS